MMTPLKTWGLLPLAVLLLSISPTMAEVVQSMTQCGDFLLNNEPPQVPDVLENGQIQDNNRYKVICQTYKDVRRFVTLYDTKNRIPLLSAYKFTGAEGGRPDVLWKIEPQLEEENGDKNMEDGCQTSEYDNQAGETDYKEALGYDTGHLFPSSSAKQEDDKESTFTLTNVVPQISSFNQGSWARMEACVKHIMKKFCINNNNVIEGYAMAGAKPSDNEENTESNPNKKRVNVPSLLWSAFCCYSKNQNRWIASAYWGDNVKENLADNKILDPKTLNQLYDELSNEDKRFEAFPGSSCPLDQTVEDVFLQLSKREKIECKKN